MAKKNKGFAKDVEETRTIPFVFSDETRDTYGTVFPVSGWDLSRFAKNPIALYNHESWGGDPDMAIGTARAWVEGKQLLGEITFEPAELNSTAEKVFRKYLAGTFRGVSIRFFPLEKGRWGEGDEARDGTKPTYYYGKRELMEISCVPIPSNKNALTRSIQNESEGDTVPETSDFFVSGEVRSIEADEEDDSTPPKEEERGDSGTDDKTLSIPDDEYLSAMANACSALSK